MKQLTLAVLLAGVVGLTGMGLPFGAGPAMWSQGGALAAWLTTGFAIAIAMSVLATAKRGFRRWQAITAAEGFAIVVLALRGGFVDLLAHGGLGGGAIALATIVGLILSTVAAIWPEPERLPELAPIA